ncbi:MAG: hypothetical protein R3E96_01750 [Planctomycetota bacterium]
MALNGESFREVHTLLRGGGILTIYPEGESRPGHVIREFRTGAARMALGAEVENDGKHPVRLQPAYLVYEEQEVPGSRVHAWVGEPIAVGPYLASFAQDDREAVRHLTADLRARLQELSVPADEQDWRFCVRLDRLLAAGPQDLPPRLQALHRSWIALPESARGKWKAENPLDLEQLELGTRRLGHRGQTA